MIVSLFRALASKLRLRLLREACAYPDLVVSDLAGRVDAAEAVVSKNLHGLAKACLLDLRPSGRHVHVRLRTDRTTRQPLPAAAAALLAELLSADGVSSPTPSKVWDWLGGPEAPVSDGDWDAAFGRLCFFFTAYTHLRRLLLMRHLAAQGPASTEQLCEAIGMSPSAAFRQLAKLRRRGLVQSVSVGGAQKWKLVPEPVSPFQRRLQRLVLDALATNR